jgi:large subunit ribosomal protein L13
MKSYMAKKHEVPRRWFVVDAQGQVLGRLASRIAMMLRGKNKPEFTPHADTGDFVVVVNADQVKLTGKKLDQKIYYRHSGYTGGLKETSARQMMKKKPEEVLRHAVRGMLPKNSLGRQQLKKLKIYTGADHPHQAQQPVPLTWED